MDGLIYIENLLNDHLELYSFLDQQVQWDERMYSRKTASFGEAYNYSQISYPYQAFPQEIERVIDLIEVNLGFRPNNCLINYYRDGKSTMGWHSDQRDILEDGTGVAIVSLGDTRVLRFREIEKKDNKIDYPLPSGSLIFMSNEFQDKWHHSIPKSPSEEGRMSLTFRKMKRV